MVWQTSDLIHHFLFFFEVVVIVAVEVDVFVVILIMVADDVAEVIKTDCTHPTAHLGCEASSLTLPAPLPVPG